jgi:hypothetical protein
MLRSTLEKAHPVSFENRVLTIGVGPEAEGYLPLLENPRNISAFQAKLKDTGFGVVQVRVIKTKGGPVPAQAPAPAAEPSAPKVAAPETPAAGVPARKAEPQPAPGRDRQAAAPVFNKEEFKNDPLIAKALEIFKGQIVEIKA